MLNKPVLDKKTIKKMKFSIELSEKRLKKLEWQELFILKATAKVARKSLTEDHKAKLKEYRRRIKENVQLRAKIGTVETWVTFDIKTYKPINFDTRKESYLYLLQRLKEKIRINRTDSKKMIYTTKTVKSVSVEMVGLVHSFEGTYGKVFNKKLIDACFKPKHPKNHLFPYVGIELEFFAEYSLQELARKLVRFSEYIEIKDDASIEIDEELIGEPECCDCGDADCEDVTYPESSWHSCELAILVPEIEMKTAVPEIIKILNKLGARTNDTCGMHVHLDMRNRNLETVYHNLVKYQDLMFSLVDEGRVNNTYCAKVPTVYYDEEAENHYNAISGKAAYSKYRTFEVRIHHGTMNLKEITSWLDLLTRIANYPSFLEQEQNLKLLADKVNLDKETLDFYESKIA